MELRRGLATSLMKKRVREAGGFGLWLAAKKVKKEEKLLASFIGYLCFGSEKKIPREFFFC